MRKRVERGNRLGRRLALAKFNLNFNRFRGVILDGLDLDFFLPGRVFNGRNQVVRGRPKGKLPNYQ